MEEQRRPWMMMAEEVDEVALVLARARATYLIDTDTPGYSFPAVPYMLGTSRVVW